MKLLVDTNIVLDVLLDRPHSGSEAEMLLLLGKIGEFQLWISPTQLSDTFYFLTKNGKEQYASQARAMLKDLRSAINVCTIGQSEFDNCLKSSWNDLEDSFLYEAAKSIHADAIISRNKKDFLPSKIPVLDCVELFQSLKTDRSIDYAEIMIAE